MNFPIALVAKTETKTPEIIRSVSMNYQSLKWMHHPKDDFMMGMFIPVLYYFNAYEADIGNGTSVRVEFCEAGYADVKKRIIGNFVSNKNLHPQYADTYIFKFKQGGEIIEAWAHKELKPNFADKYVIVGESYLPIIKSLYRNIQLLSK